MFPKPPGNLALPVRVSTAHYPRMGTRPSQRLLAEQNLMAVINWTNGLVIQPVVCPGNRIKAVTVVWKEPGSWLFTRPRVSHAISSAFMVSLLSGEKEMAQRLTVQI